MTVNGREICSRYLDDLPVGETFETHGRTVTEYDLVAFGALTGDTNPQHLDRRFGERGPFGERIAHGALIVSFALALVPIDADRLVALRRLRDVRFRRPVTIGDSIRVRVRVAECVPVDDHVGRVVLAAAVVNQRDEVVARAEIETLWRRLSAEESWPAHAGSALPAAAGGDSLHELPGLPL
jgi:3-hydroxybutyryl-CoA dehydratase